MSSSLLIQSESLGKEAAVPIVFFVGFCGIFFKFPFFTIHKISITILVSILGHCSEGNHKAGCGQSWGLG